MLDLMRVDPGRYGVDRFLVFMKSLGLIIVGLIKGFNLIVEHY